ncbi:unnamed protein product [Mytilus coruscus]|uniref:YqaJ viral recombinase domain-containing protein n=1 Tax=Mytilus coruscus TaxID=42192 RepID=A0A6J8BMC5_MYTCO|nr:unnamed protein product [Mytilus coruscus]
MEGKKESDVDLTIQALNDTEKLGVEYRKQLRMVNTRIRNLQEDKLIEATQNEQKTNIISGKLEKIAAGNNEVTILLEKFQNNRNKYKELANLPMKREEKGIQASESAVFVRAYAYPSMRKNNPPYRLTIKAEAQKPKKRKRVVEGILPNVYCPVKQPIPSVEFTSTLVQHLASFQSDAQILKSVRNPTDITMIHSSFGPVPFGSVLSYQQRPSTIETNIINHQNMPSFPEFILPHHDNDFTTVLNQSENEVYLGLQFNHASALELERETIHQGQTKLWHKVRQHRLTSSIFKDVCGRKADFEKLAERLLNKKNIQTAAMKFGIEHESAAAKLYSDITGNNMYLCGEDYHKERIYMDEDKWLDIKSSLNKFYFEILLPQIVKQSSK